MNNSKNLTSKRKFAEQRFKFYGLLSLFLALIMLVVIISSMTYRSIPVFTNYGINLEVKLSDKVVDRMILITEELFVKQFHLWTLAVKIEDVKEVLQSYFLQELHMI